MTDNVFDIDPDSKKLENWVSCPHCGSEEIEAEVLVFPGMHKPMVELTCLSCGGYTEI